MKTQYKHIHFESAGPVGEESVYRCKNNESGSILGEISYYAPWRRYIFEGWRGAVFDESCLRDIIDFLQQLK